MNTCLFCGEKTTNKKYCSNKCQQEFQWKEIKKQIEENGFFPKTQNPSRYLVRYLTETFGYICSECFISEWKNKPLTLQVDHIDGDAENNSVDNVRYLCPNCHSQTETYGSKNVGNGRKIRRDRYLPL